MTNKNDGFVMKTGLLNENSASPMLNHEVEAILFALLKKTIESASQYTNDCNRQHITPTDVEYAMKYEAHIFFFRETLNEDVNECLKIIEDASDDDDSNCSIEDSDSDDGCVEHFCRGDSTQFCKRVNQIVDAWQVWNPSDHLQKSLKAAIDNVYSQ
jgi:hypothetical protein